MLKLSFAITAGTSFAKPHIEYCGNLWHS